MATHGTVEGGADHSTAKTFSATYRAPVRWIESAQVLVSESTDPYINQALEYYCLHYLPLHSALPFTLVYRNKPSVHMGRFQNPWLETNPSLLYQSGIALLRRLSGGGTVYHDLGNLNCCLLWSTPSILKNTRIWPLQVMQQFVSRFSPQFHLEIGEKYDLLAKDSKAKVSGSAFRAIKNRELHHFTLLLSSNLDQLQHALNPLLKSTEVATMARPSRRAWVENVMKGDAKNQWEWNQVINDLCGVWEKSIIDLRCGLDAPTDFLITKIGLSNSLWDLSLNKGEQQTISVPVHYCSSWDYIIGETPAFQVKTVDAQDHDAIILEKGIISKEQAETLMKWGHRGELLANNFLKAGPYSFKLK